MADDWRKQSERSTRFMLSLIAFIGTRVPRRAVRLLLYPIVVYFLITGGRSTRASIDFLRKALQRKPTLTDRWRHYFAFASCTLDRILLLGGQHRSIRVDATRSAGIKQIVGANRGCLLIVAHFGSTEVLRFTPPAVDTGVDSTADSDSAREATHIKTSILMDRNAGKMLTELLERLNPRLALNIIDASERGPQLVLKLKEALQAGSMVCVMADRVTEGEGFVTVDFLGGKARFAETPWILASVLRVPVILGFGIYQGGNRYSSHFELFADDPPGRPQSRSQQIAEFAQRYASRLEHYVRLAPYNWFNFYDFWLNDEKADRR